MAVLHLTCGKIACGKTYFAEKFCAGGRAVLFSVDRLMLTVYDGCLGEDHIRHEQKCMDFLLETAVNTVKCGAFAALDFGFWNYEVRRRVSEYCLNNGIDYVWHYFNADEKTRKSRLEKRNAVLAESMRREYIIDDEMLARFDGWFEFPREDERMVYENDYQ